MLFTDVDKLGPSRDFLTPQICFLTLFAKIPEFTVKMKNTTHHPLKQKWTVPINNGGESIRLKWVKPL